MAEITGRKNRMETQVVKEEGWEVKVVGSVLSFTMCVLSPRSQADGKFKMVARSEVNLEEKER